MPLNKLHKTLYVSLYFFKSNTFCTNKCFFDIDRHSVCKQNSGICGIIVTGYGKSKL